jgi:hypothetical protein
VIDPFRCCSLAKISAALAKKNLQKRRQQKTIFGDFFSDRLGKISEKWDAL